MPSPDGSDDEEYFPIRTMNASPGRSGGCGYGMRGCGIGDANGDAGLPRLYLSFCGDRHTAEVLGGDFSPRRLPSIHAPEIALPAPPPPPPSSDAAQKSDSAAADPAAPSLVSAAATSTAPVSAASASATSLHSFVSAADGYLDELAAMEEREKVATKPTAPRIDTSWLEQPPAPPPAPAP